MCVQSTIEGGEGGDGTLLYDLLQTEHCAVQVPKLLQCHYIGTTAALQVLFVTEVPSTSKPDW